MASKRGTKWIKREAERMRRGLETRRQVEAELPDDPTARLVAGIALSSFAHSSQDRAQGDAMAAAGSMLVGSWATEFFRALASAK